MVKANIKLKLKNIGKLAKSLGVRIDKLCKV